MYSVLFIGKGVITASLAQSLERRSWNVEHYTRANGDLKTFDLSRHDYVVACLPDADVGSHVWHDILASAVKDKACKTIFIDISTLTREAIIKINADFCREKLSFIEAPFTGSKTGAQNASLIYFASSSTLQPEADEFLKSTSSTIYNFHSAGDATRFKLFYNLWGLTSLGVFGQMLQIINTLPQKDLVSEILTSHEGFWMGAIAKQKLHQSLSRQYEDVHCKLKYAKKDILYAMDEFNDHKLDLSRCLFSLLDKDQSQQYDDLDFTSMCEFFK